MAVSIRTDEAIQADVLEELKWDIRVRPNEIGVVVKDGIVTLTGWIDSYLKKMSAQEAAHRVIGVKAVANDIEVSVPVSAERTDTDLARVALNTLNWDDALWDAGIPTDKIEIMVDHGWVMLKGEVDYYFQKRDAELLMLSLHTGHLLCAFLSAGAYGLRVPPQRPAGPGWLAASSAGAAADHRRSCPPPPIPGAPVKLAPAVRT